MRQRSFAQIRQEHRVEFQPLDAVHRLQPDGSGRRLGLCLRCLLLLVPAITFPLCQAAEGRGVLGQRLQQLQRFLALLAPALLQAPAFVAQLVTNVFQRGKGPQRSQPCELLLQFPDCLLLRGPSRVGRRQRRQIELYQKENAELDKKTRMMKDNRDTLERYAREQFYFAEPGDDVYIIE